MTQTIPMRAAREHLFNSFQEAFLTIGDKHESLRFEEGGSLCLNHVVKVIDKPRPIVIIFSIDDRISYWKQGAVCIHSRRSKENPLVFAFQVGAVKPKDG